MKDPYTTLGVSRSASEKDIKKAYRKLAGKYHPDRNPDNKQAEQTFKEINAAYDVLGNKDKRKLYDEFGESSTSSNFDADKARRFKDAFGGFGGGGQSAGGNGFFGNFQNAAGGFGGGVEDLFSRVFSGGARSAPRQGPQKGADRSSKLSVDFLKALKGGEMTIRTGGETLDVNIPAGVKDGQKIRLRGLGAEGLFGGTRGDLVVTIEVEPHPTFRREGDDIHVDVNVTLRELIEGDKINVFTPEGTLELKVPAGSQNGRKLRLRGLGAPRKGSERGHLYVHLNATLPESSDPKLIELARQMDAFYSKPVRAV